MRIRTIKPEFWKSEDTERLSEPAMLLAIGLLNYADDEGLFNANPKLIKAELFPMRDPSRPIADLLAELAGTGFIALGAGEDGRTYGRIVTFRSHQRIDRPQPSKIKHLCRFDEPSASIRGTIVEPSRKEQVTGSMDHVMEAEVVPIAQPKPKAKSATPDAIPAEYQPTPEAQAAWAEWLAYRRSKAKPVTAIAAKQQFKLLAEWGAPAWIAAIQSSIANDYQGLFPPRDGPRAARQPQPATNWSEGDIKW